MVKEVDSEYLDGGEEGEIRFVALCAQKCKPGDELTVFIYLDNEEWLVATTLTPLCRSGNSCLSGSGMDNQYGAFPQLGIDEDLFVPFRAEDEDAGWETIWSMCASDDESYRIVASAKVDRYLSKEKGLIPAREVNILIWQKRIGFKHIIENRYMAYCMKARYFSPCIRA